ncbi:MAG: DUF302 domain-containing protein [Pseudomonadota bacterium]
MKTLLLVIGLVGLSGCAASGLQHHSDGKIAVPSAHDVPTTEARLRKTLSEKGFTVFTTIDHAAGASSVGLSLRPTRVVVFGNPKAGAPLMGCEQTIAIDLPQKALIHQDENNSVWLTYNDPVYLAARHNVSGCDVVFAKIAAALSAITASVTSED